MDAEGPPVTTTDQAQGQVVVADELTQVPTHLGFSEDRVGRIADKVNLNDGADPVERLAADKKRRVVAETAFVETRLRRRPRIHQNLGGASRRRTHLRTSPGKAQ